MYMKGSPEIRYQIINETIKEDNNLLNISYLCNIAGVSRSGFYSWRNGSKIRMDKEEQDKKDFELILSAYQHRGYAKGARGIHMQLLHQNPSVCINLKKIRRLMKKFHLICPLRRVNPYRMQSKRLQENRVAPNILNRQFRAYGPRTVLLTDITFIPRSSHHGANFPQKYTYVCVIMDAYTKQILSCICSPSCETDFVLETITELMNKHGSELQTNTLIHSDQGCQYTSSRFITILNDFGLRQSMSRRGNCWDNAPQESFFGHMKDEIHVNCYDSHQQVQSKVLDWINYYNTERYQWNLAKLSPNQFYEYVTTGEYALNLNIEKGGVAPKPLEFNEIISKEGKEKDENNVSPSLQI